MATHKSWGLKKKKLRLKIHNQITQRDICEIIMCRDKKILQISFDFSFEAFVSLISGQKFFVFIITSNRASSHVTSQHLPLTSTLILSDFYLATQIIAINLAQTRKKGKMYKAFYPHLTRMMRDTVCHAWLPYWPDSKLLTGKTKSKLLFCALCCTAQGLNEMMPINQNKKIHSLPSSKTSLDHKKCCKSINGTDGS